MENFVSKTPQRPAFVSSTARLTVRKCPFYITNQLKAQLKLSRAHDDIVHVNYSYTGFVEVPVVKNTPYAERVQTHARITPTACDFASTPCSFVLLFICFLLLLT